MATISKAELAQRANDELAAASDALFRVRAQLRAIESTMEERGLPLMQQNDVLMLVATSIEVASQYAERAAMESEFFAEHGSQATDTGGARNA